MKMTWFARSAAFATIGMPLALAPSIGWAQEQRSKAAVTGAIQEEPDPSVLVLALAPIDTMLPNVQHLARLVAGGTGAGTVATILRQYTGGLDTARPAGVFVELDETGNPTPIACLPLKNLEDFFSNLAIFGEPEDLGDGLYQFNVGNSVYLRKAGDWLVVGQTEDGVLDFDTKTATDLKAMVGKYDLRFQVNPQNIPDELVDFMMSQMEAGIEQGMANNQGLDAAQAEAARANAEQMMNSIEEAVNGTEKFVFGLAVNKAEKTTMLDFGSKFVADSKFAKQIEKLKTSKASLGGIPVEGSMMTMQALQLIAPEEVKQLEDSLDASLEAAFKQIEERTNDAAAVDKAKEFLGRLVELVMASAKEGQMEAAMNVSVDKQLSIVAGLAVADGKKVEALAAEASKALAAENVDIKLEVMTGKHGGANLHKLTVPIPGGQDEVRKIFGDNLTVAVATAPKAVHLAIGKDCDTVIKSVIDRVGSMPSSQGEMIKARFSLGQLLQFIQSIEANPAVEAMAEVAAGGSDKIAIDSKSGDRETVVRISLEDNVLKAISAAATAARGGGF